MFQRVQNQPGFDCCPSAVLLRSVAQERSLLTGELGMVTVQMVGPAGRLDGFNSTARVLEKVRGHSARACTPVLGLAVAVAVTLCHGTTWWFPIAIMSSVSIADKARWLQ